MASEISEPTKNKLCFLLFAFNWIFFTGKQKKILKVLMPQIKVFEVCNKFWLKKLFLKVKTKPEIGFVSFLIHFSQITHLKPNKITYPHVNLWNYSFIIVFSLRQEKTFEIGVAHVKLRPTGKVNKGPSAPWWPNFEKKFKNKKWT